MNYNLWKRIELVKLVIFDVDGVLTDGGITYITNDGISRRFDVKDGLGIVLLKSYGIIPAVITGKRNEMIERRATILGIEDLLQGFPDKIPALEHLLEKYSISDENVCFIGDDVIDVSVMRRAGFSAAPSDAHPVAKDAADFVVPFLGGEGAVRYLIDMLISFKTGDFSRITQIPPSLASEWEKIAGRMR